MALLYKLVRRFDPAHREEGLLTLAQVKYTDETSFQQICEMISLRSLQTRSDVETVLGALIKEVSILTSNSRSVHLGEFGSIHLAMGTEQVLAEADYKKEYIRGVRYVFTPGSQLKAALKAARFKASNDPKTEEEETEE